MRTDMRICLAALLVACDARPLVVVSVAPLPSEAAELYASLSYRGKPALSPSPLRFDLTGADLSQPATFGVRLDANTDGDLVVGAGILDPAGCLLAFGSGATEKISKTPQLDVALGPASQDELTPELRCQAPETTPLLLGVTPPIASSTGGTRVVIRGWGFGTTSCPHVNINVVAATDILCPSLVELSATVPPSSQIGPVPLQVVNATGRYVTSARLFSYYAEQIRLGPPVSYPVGGAPSAMAAGLIDKNQSPDLVVSSRDSDLVTVLLNGNSGRGDFPSGFASALVAGVRPSAVALGDVNSDGEMDILAVSAGDRQLSIFAQVQPGTVPASFRSEEHVFVNLLPSAIALADVDGDGALDATVANQLSSDVSLLLNDGRGGFIKSAARDYAVPREPLSVVFADLNQDGKPDLLVRSAATATLTVLTNSGGGFSANRRSDTTFAAAPLSLAVGDIDGDGSPDAVVALADSSFHVLWNDRSGRLFEDRQSVVSLSGGGRASALGLLDLDQDGSLDVVAASGSSRQLFVLRNTRVRRGIKGLELLPDTYPAGPDPVAIATADFDRDGLPDVAVADRSLAAVSILFNQSK